MTSEFLVLSTHGFQGRPRLMRCALWLCSVVILGGGRTPPALTCAECHPLRSGPRGKGHLLLPEPPSWDGGLRLACWPLLGVYISPHSRLPPKYITDSDGEWQECVISSVVSQQKFETTDELYSSRMDQCYSSVLQLSFI